MGKTLETIAFVGLELGVAIFAPELLPATWSLLAVTAATAAIEIGVALAATALIGPTLPKGLGKAVQNQQERLFVTMDTTAPRKILFGDTAAATDLRYQAYTGANQRYYEQIIAIASHGVNAIYEIWFDNEKAWTLAGGVQGRYVGFLTVDVRTAGTNANGIAIDGIWTSACTLTGCAYVHLKYDLLGTATDGSNNSPFASGVTTRVTIRAQGAPVYDPRLDSTVAGGSGSQRAATQTTWAWGASASRNPALQLLFYQLGWDINGKLAVGMGLPPAKIDLASFAVAANACDESIALNGGGTEPRYRADGVFTEGDDRQSAIETLCASMNAVPRDASGKLSLTVLHNDLATPVASFTEADIIGEEKWEQTPDLSATFNICRGRRVDASDNGLYQLSDVPEAKLTSNDGVDRIDTMDMPLVQSNGQAQRLLKQRLQRKQYQGRYTLTGKPKWWQTSLGDVIQQSHQGLGWANKLFRVAGQSIARTGETKMVLVEENAALYAWDNSESAPVTPAAGTVYDPLNSPLLAGINGLAADINALNSDIAALESLASDNILTVQEKLSSMLKLVADLDARDTDLVTRATALGLSTAALSTARTNWKNYLAALAPAWNDTTADTILFTSEFADQNYPTGWGTTSASTAASGIYTNVQDASGTAAGFISRAQSGISGANHTHAALIRVLKDGTTSRFCRLELSTAGGTAKTGGVNLNTSTGVTGDGANLEANSFGALDLGTEWLLYAVIKTNTGNTSVTVKFYPAFTASIGASSATVATTGTCSTAGPLLTGPSKTVNDLGRYYLDGLLNAYGTALTQLLTAISGMDASTSIVITGPAQTVVTADVTGTVKTGQLPRTVNFKAGDGLTDYSTLGTWSFTQTPSAGITATIDAGTGILTITALGAGSTALVISFVYGGVTRTFPHIVLRQNDPPTSTGGGSGGGGGSSSTTTLGPTTGASYDTTNAVSATLTCTASGGGVACAAPLNFLRSTTSGGSSHAWGKWQWRVVGGTFADIAAEVESAYPAQTLSDMSQYEGTLNVTQTKTGLTNGTNYEFRFLWRNNSGTVPLYLSDGTLTATGT